MDADTYSNADVIKLSNEKFLNVKVDADQNHALAQKFARQGLPTTVVLDGDGDVITTLVGYQEPGEYIKSLNKSVKGFAHWTKAKAAFAENEESPAGFFHLASAHAEMGNAKLAQRHPDLVYRIVGAGRYARPAAPRRKTL